MKFFIFLLAFSFSGMAFAGEVTSVDVLNYDGETLSYSYTTGGGCSVHTPEVKLDLKVSADKYLETAVVQIFDTTNKPDMCEAIIRVEGSVNLKQLIKKEVEARGIKGNYFQVQLPKLSVGTD